jgi:hypothetical protein
MNIATRFNQIFWGLLLVILDLRLSRIDVLPDFIGYILVALGCGGLVALSSQFSTARIVSWILVVSSLAWFVVTGLGWVFTLVHIALDCVLMWFLLGGVMEFASAKTRPDFAERASKLRIAYVALMAVGALAGIVARASHNVAKVMAFVVIIGSVILLAFILHLIHRVKRELAVEQAA